MNLREALRADFGIEVRIEGGTGARTDPFVIEACSAADATATQLDLLRGLCRGRRELWRLLDVEAVGDGSPTLQKVNIETVRFSADQIYSETRAYYFDVRKVDGRPNAAQPPPVWSDARSDFSAPHQLGWLHFDRAIDNAAAGTELDVTLLYSGPAAKAAVYIYGAPEIHVARQAGLDARIEELEQVSNGILHQYPQAEAPWPRSENPPFLVRYFIVGDDLSLAGVADMGRHFVKIRLTFHDEPKMRELMNGTMRDLCRCALRGS